MQEEMKFSRIGGALQIRLQCFDDLPGILKLDEAHWAITAADCSQFCFEPAFLRFLDTNKSGRIHSGEVREAVSFLLDHLKCGGGVDQWSDTLNLADIRLEGPHGQEIFDAARLILRNLGKPEATSISIAEISADESIKACSCSNGDGIIAQCPSLDPLCSEALAVVLEFMEKPLTDLSGAPGADEAAMEKTETALRNYLAHRAELQEVPGLLPFGKETVALFSRYGKVAERLDRFFLASEAERFLAGFPDPAEKRERPAEVFSASRLPGYLEDCPAALLRADGTLDFGGPLNPLYAEDLLAFAAEPAFSGFLENRRLSFAAWKTLKKQFSPYAAWRERVPEHAAFFAERDEEKLKEFLAKDAFGKLRKLAREDLALADVHAAGMLLLKLALYQKYMLEFVNNFVSLSELFNPAHPSRLQAGKLVLDGRHFTLVMPVRNLEEHKRILKGSDICVAYFEARRKTTDPVRLYAAAITSGSERTLFPGKRGIFFSADGLVFDARILELQLHPVSIAEALKSPFFRFGAFVGEQADKLFSTQSALSQKELSKAITTGKIMPPPVPKAPMSGSMLLMGGGLGLAALGSSVAFIIKSLQNVSIFSVVMVFFCIMLIFGGPMVFLSLVQLFRRDVGRFLESSGCAVNRRMRLSCRLGAFFSFTPVRKGRFLDLVDPAEILRSGTPKRMTKTLCWLLLVLAVTAAGACAGWYFLHFLTPEKQTKSVVTVCVPTGKTPVKNK